MTTGKDNIYVNVIINGNNPTYNTDPLVAASGEGGVLAEYKTTKSQAYLDKPSDYYCSVTRFAIPLQYVPITIMPIIPNQADPDKSTILFGILYKGVHTSLYVEYFPDNLFQAPVQDKPIQVITPYYYIYSYSHMIQMFNETLKQLWVSSTLAADFPLLVPPYFYLDTSTQLISIVVPNVFVDPSIASLYFNNSTLNYIDGFHLSFYGNNQQYGEDNVFIFENIPQYYYPTPGIPSTPQYYVYTQDYTTLYNWNSLRKLLISTNTIPISNEIIPPNRNGDAFASYPIITDFIVPSSNAGDTRSVAIYNPTAQYRLVDMSGDNPLSTIDLRILWSDINGNLYPLFIPQNQQASIKLAFFRKSLYKNQ